MKQILVIASAMFILFGTTVNADEHLDSIKFGWGGTIWGYGYWTIWQDDVMEYEAGFDGVYENMPGWRWKNWAKFEGKARFRNKGAYARARAIADTALSDPILSKPPTGETPQCLDAGLDYIWFKFGDTMHTIERDGCFLFSDQYGFHVTQYSNRVTLLLTNLNKALQTKGLKLE